MDIRRLLGPIPLGDPSLMRDRATRIQAEADRLSAHVAHVSATIASLAFEGPAADRFRSDMQVARHEATDTAHRLHELAAYIVNAANSVEQGQRTWTRRLHELEAEAARRARQAAEGGRGGGGGW